MGSFSADSERHGNNGMFLWGMLEGNVEGWSYTEDFENRVKEGSENGAFLWVSLRIT